MCRRLYRFEKMNVRKVAEAMARTHHILYWPLERWGENPSYLVLATRTLWIDKGHSTWRVFYFQLNEVTPFFDGNLMYGPNKAWSDTLRLFKDGLLAATNDSTDPSALDRDRYFPALNDIRLPFANPPPPRDHVLKPVKRFHSESIILLLFFWHALV